MTSTMTEREFRERVTRYGILADNAVAAAREAGLEFAPEPLLPAKVMTGPCGPSGVWIGPNSGGPLLQCHHETTVPFAEALAARYNAYPGLRVRASALLEAVSDRFGPGTLGYVKSETAALEMELAKGPK